MAVENPALGQVRISNELRREGLVVSPGGVRSVWLRHGLQTFRQRLKALEAKVAAEGTVLTEAQVAALERKKEDDLACGEIETAHPGHLGSQDTFYVGTLKGVGRIYQQTLYVPPEGQKSPIGSKGRFREWVKKLVGGSALW
jgi:hypothetical protein